MTDRDAMTTSRSELSRRAQALVLAEELLSDIELSRTTPTAVIRKASRLARLIDDEEALLWLGFEVHGYLPEPGNKLGPEAWAAAQRSHRIQRNADDGSLSATTTLVGELEVSIEAGKEEIAASTDPGISVSSANPNQFITLPTGNAGERLGAATRLAKARAVLDRVIGAVHAYVTATYQALRFGSAVESAFDVVRQEVDQAIAALIPDALTKLNAAMENLSSDNPEHWAQAAASCRRLLKAAADALRPPGPDVDGRKMGDTQYINRLVDWIQSALASHTMKDSISADLEYLGHRLDAFDDAGHKGAHAEVERVEAARFVTGTYLLLGDLLRLGTGRPAAPAEAISDEPVNGPATESEAAGTEQTG